jgi:hypothetical protein
MPRDSQSRSRRAALLIAAMVDACSFEPCSDTHRPLHRHLMGIAALYPSYKTKAAGSNPRRLEFKIAG